MGQAWERGVAPLPRRRRPPGRGWTVLRRGIALGMALTAAWGVALTADLSGAAGALRAAWGSGTVAAAALRAELGPSVLGDTALGGLQPWQRLAVEQSPALLAGREAVDRLLSAGAADSPPPEGPAEEAEPEPRPTGSAGAEGAVPQTLGPSEYRQYDQAEGIYVANPTGLEVDVAAMAAAPVELTLPEEGPQILIFHTHGTEAYTPAGEEDVYEPTDPYRTLDTDFNVVRVGEELARALEEEGFSVLHDTTLYDYPSYNDAYDRSLEGVAALLEEHPTVRVVLDVHRDALEGEDGTVYKTMTEGTQAAQVMLVMGTDGNGLPHARWRENLTLAVHLQRALNGDCPTLARPISLRGGRYNQQLSTGALLLEVGSHGNTLDEALSAARLFARSAAEVLSGLWEA